MDANSQRGGGEVEVRATSGGKRILAPTPCAAPPLPPTSQTSALQRELVGAQPSQKSLRWTSFNHFQLQYQWDLYVQQSGEASCWPPFYLRRRSAVREVLAAHGVVIALAESGVCAAYDQDTGDGLCFLNAEADEDIRTLFITAATLITVSVFSGDSLQRLRVRATPLAAVRARRPQLWRPLFASELLCWPGFVEFDDVNNVACTCSADTSTYKVWDLQAPGHPQFHLASQGVANLKVAAGALLLTMEGQQAAGEELHLRVLDLQEGGCVQELRLPLSSPACASSAGMEVVELFGQWLLTKEHSGPLRITDIVTGTAREVAAAAFPPPSAFIHLPFNHSFLAFWQEGDAQLWSFCGELLSTLPDVSLSAAANSNTIFVTNTQDLLFVYSPPGSGRGESTAGQLGAARTGGAAAAGHAAAAAAAAAAAQDRTKASAHLGCLRVFDLLAGRQVAAVQQQAQPQGAAAGKCAATRAAAAAAALKHVTALFYDETTHRLYTGSADGKVQTWAL